MVEPIILASHVGKKFKLGAINSTTLREQLSTQFSRILNKHTTESNSFWALQDVSFSLNRGEVLGIIGKNGSGKSTLLKILSRITAPTSGMVHINGQLSSLLEVGTGFHPELTGRENVFLNGSILGMKRKEIAQKYDEIVDFAGIRKFMDTPVKRYSSGMYVRLAFAVAAHLQPEILIVDEVLAVGDHEFQKKCLGKMNQVASEGRSVIFVSHNMGAVSELCTRVILLDAGHIVFDGGVSEGISRYISSRTSQSNGFVADQNNLSDEARSTCFIEEGWCQNDSGERTADFMLNENINIHLNVRMNSRSSNIRASVVLFRNSLPVFTSFSDDQEITLNQVGSQNIHLSIEPNFLKAGDYTAELYVSPPVFKSPHSLKFTVHEESENVFNKGYRKDRLGEVIVQGKWVLGKS